jgi:hypothetical protein
MGIARGTRVPRFTLTSIAACMSIAGCTIMPAPSRFPEFDYIDAKPVVVVADVRPGDFLAPFEECKSEDVICPRDPMWLRVSLRETLYGTPPATHLTVFTTSHNGLDGYNENRAPRLMVLMIGPNGEAVMPSNSQAPITRRKDGTWFLPFDGIDATWFLPCGIAGLQEPVDPTQFPPFLETDYNESWILEHPTFFQTIDDKAYPRFGIAISRIRDALNRERPQATAMQCESTIDSR